MPFTYFVFAKNFEFFNLLKVKGAIFLNLFGVKILVLFSLFNIKDEFFVLWLFNPIINSFNFLCRLLLLFILSFITKVLLVLALEFSIFLLYKFVYELSFSISLRLLLWINFLNLFELKCKDIGLFVVVGFLSFFIFRIYWWNLLNDILIFLFNGNIFLWDLLCTKKVFEGEKINILLLVFSLEKSGLILSLLIEAELLSFIYNLFRLCSIFYFIY